MKFFRGVLFSLALAGLAAGLAGCAAESISYPTLSSVKNIKDRILSREEQEEAIRDLSAEREKQETDAGKETEKAP